MAGSTRRAAWAVLALGAAFTSLVGCGGDDDVASFTVDFSTAEDAQDVFNDSLLRAVELCGSEDPPERVQWEFSGSDEESPIAQEYIRLEYPSYIDCASIQGGKGSPPPGVDAQASITAGQARHDGPEGG